MLVTLPSFCEGNEEHECESETITVTMAVTQFSSLKNPVKVVPQYYVSRTAPLDSSQQKKQYASVCIQRFIYEVLLFTFYWTTEVVIYNNRNLKRRDECSSALFSCAVNLTKRYQ
jgi:hypothetical protein